MTDLVLENNKIAELIVKPKPADLYTRFQTEKVIIEMHDSDYGIVGHIRHANETYIIFDPEEEHRHPLLIPWTSIYTIRLWKKEPE